MTVPRGIHCACGWSRTVPGDGTAESPIPFAEVATYHIAIAPNAPVCGTPGAVSYPVESDGPDVTPEQIAIGDAWTKGTAHGRAGALRDIDRAIREVVSSEAR